MITTPRLFLALCLVLSGLGAAAGSAAEARADADYAAVVALSDQLPPWASRGPDGELKNERKPAPSERSLWSDRQGEAKAKAALKFMADHPADPRRWDAAVIALNSMRSFVVTIKLGYDEAVAAGDSARVKALIEYDTAAKAGWEERMQALEAAVLAASDASAEAVGGALNHAGVKVIINPALSPAEKLEKWHGIFATFAQRAPESIYFRPLCNVMLLLAEREDPAAYAALLQEMKASPSAAVAALATDRLKAQAAREAGFDLKFTAVDGREVDITKLRGKVVLIDFWATWCGPCIAELPHIKQVYAAYHNKGFEIVGIALENARLAPTDTPEQTAAKHEKAKQVLNDFTAKHDMPWPQYYDGNNWKAEIATRYGIMSIPAMFLIDQNGKLVTTAARGEKLETEVKRLLGL